MTTAVDPQDAHEQARIAVVHAFDILDTPPEGTFDRIAAVAARTFDASSCNGMAPTASRGSA